jgi:flagellar protein FliS
MDTLNRALNAYAQVDVQMAVASASPVQVIILLYDGAINALASAKGKMQEMRLAEKGHLISKGIGIIEGLRSVLDQEKGGEIARNLENLYDYMKRRLVAANLKNEAEGLDEVMRLLSNLREAWIELDTRERQAAAAPSAKVSASANPVAGQATVSLRA